jgi:hypothetical protein
MKNSQCTIETNKRLILPKNHPEATEFGVTKIPPE